MPYKVSFHTRFEQDLKAFKKNPNGKKLVKAQVDAVIANPDLGVPMKGKISGVYKVPFGSHPAYRLLYRKFKCCQSTDEAVICPMFDSEVPKSVCQGAVIFISIKTRQECDNHYRKNKKYFDGTNIEGLTPL